MTRPADIPQWAWDEADRVLGDMPEVAFEAHDIRPAWEFVARALLAACERGRGEQRNPNLDEAERQAIRNGGRS